MIEFRGTTSSVLVILTLMLIPHWGRLRADEVEDSRRVSVGQQGYISQLLIPGSKLEPIPVVDRDSIVIVRIRDIYPNGDSWRYDLEYYAMEPGQYNLLNYMQRVDGSSKDSLEPVLVSIVSVLEPGQIEPNELQLQSKPWLGGYYLLVILFCIAWIVVMLTILFGFRKKKASEALVKTKTSFADLLRPQLEKAKNGELDSKGLAELERLVTEFWKRKLALDNGSQIDVLNKIKSDPQAGSYYVKMESWLHAPQAESSANIEELLEPYRDIEAADIIPTNSANLAETAI